MGICHYWQNDPELFDAVAAAALLRIGEFSPQGLSITAWAFATVSRSDPKLFHVIAAASLTRVRAFSEQNIANMAWAYAKASRNDALLFDALAVGAVTKIDEFIPQGLSNMVWAYATVNRRESKLFDAVAAASLTYVGSFTTQNLANMAWAFAKIEIYDRILFDALAAEALPKFGDFNSLDFAYLMWAFAKVGRHDASLFQAAAATVLPRIDHCGTPELGMIAWAFDQADLPSTAKAEKLFAAIVKKALKANLIGLDSKCGPQRSDTIEAQCAELVLQWIPGAMRNRYHQMGRELDIVFQAADGSLVNIEIDEVYHRTPRQRSIDSRRDRLLRRLGVHVVRFDAFDEFGREREDLAEALHSSLRAEGILALFPV
ncbi:unnamed protein product [Polarella glacialis]|uniref:RNA-editing substrate-binding complex 6 protein domain-containing protein n=1 Tax=Polarella glacialis TaxID=89957 RepID=A0A813J2M4_POLGL|nr:unnamed protein product [Polarella glacialis]